ncbi:FAD/NAD(P)-binding domain containing protein [Hyaloscypha variabilis]
MSPKLNIVIIGAGIAGLTTAIALRRSGHTLGGRVGISPSGSRILIAHGLGDVLRKMNVRENVTNFRRYENGAILTSTGTQNMEDVYGSPHWSFSRYRLQKALAEIARQRGVEIRFSCQVEGIDEDCPSVILRDGTVIPADLIIGADGVRSRIRDSIVGGSIKPIVFHTSYNTEIPRSLIAQDPSLIHLLTSFDFWFGPGKEVMSANMPDRDDIIQMSLISRFAGFEPSIGKLLDLAKTENGFIWKLAELPSLKSWVSTSGKLVAIGDAVHAMVPYAGMGAVQGIEDAGSLAVCLEHLQKLADLPGLLKVFEAIRRPRAEFMMKVARERAVGLFLPDGKEQEQRDNSFKEHQIDLTDKNWDGKCSDDPPEGGLLSPLYAGYMFGFDVMDHTKRQLQRILAQF